MFRPGDMREREPVLHPFGAETGGCGRQGGYLEACAEVIKTP